MDWWMREENRYAVILRLLEARTFDERARAA